MIHRCFTLQEFSGVAERRACGRKRMCNMAYEVLARKWRPRQFDDVVGQAHVTETLKNAIKTDRIAHAYLFVGPRGIGKTSVARIFAKALNCAEGPTAQPCGQCDSCVEIARGSNLDVLEIDGASNNGVEQIRDLRDTLKYAPAKAPYKIYIIDEVHMLSSGAFNALLKTLEEPPPHVKFVFATTEPQKILPTIISRCQRFDLRRIPVPLIMERLRMVAQAEEVAITEDALLAIARGADGGLRDAESALDQLISFKGKSIDEPDVLSVFGLVSREALEESVSMILDGRVAELIVRVADLDRQGKDLQRLVFDLIDHFKNLLICHYVEKMDDGLDLAEVQIATLRRQLDRTTPDHVLRIIRILMETEDRMRYALLRRTLLETALIRCARAATTVSLEQVLERIENLDETACESSASPGSAPAARTEKAATRPPPEEAAPPVAERKVAKRKDSAGAVAQAPPERAEAASPSERDELALLRENWMKVREKAGKASLELRRILAGAVPLAVEGDCVVVGFDPEFAEEIEMVGRGRNPDALKRALRNTLERDVVFEMRAATAEQLAQGAAPVRARPGGKSAPRAADDDESDSTPPPSDRKVAAPPEAPPLLDDPAILKTMDMFDAKILDVRS